MKFFDETMKEGFRTKRFVHFQTQPWDDMDGSGIERYIEVFIYLNMDTDPNLSRLGRDQEMIMVKLIPI